MADKTNPLLQDEHDDVTGLLGSLLKAVGRLPKALPSDDQAQLARGRTVLVAPTNIPELLVNSETYPEEHDFVVSIQTASLPVDNSGGVWGGAVPSTGCGVLQYTIQYSVGEAQFQVVGDIASLQVIQRRITARKIIVSVAWTQTFHPSVTNVKPIYVTGGVGRTDLLPSTSNPNQTQWYRTPAGLYTQGATNGLAVASSNTELLVGPYGKVEALLGSLVSGPASPTVSWIMLFDFSGALGPVANALPLWVSDPVLVGQGFSFQDLASETYWNYGLWCGVSSTPDVFTPVSGATFSLSVKGG